MTEEEHRGWTKPEGVNPVETLVWGLLGGTAFGMILMALLIAGM